MSEQPFVGDHSYEIVEIVPAKVLGVVPEPVAEALKKAAESGQCDVLPARLSATVVLVRETDEGLKLWMMQRPSGMVFGGAWVFPGGKLEAEDEIAPDPLRACAVREVAEETGLTVDPEDLLHWAWWITPEHMRRRFDTHFYLYEVPADVEPENIGGEADVVLWESPEVMLKLDGSEGVEPLMPPTRALLMELVLLGTMQKVREAAQIREVKPVLPRYLRRDGEWIFSYPQRDGSWS